MNLDELAKAISHDLRAPLRHVGSYAQLLAESLEGTLDEKQTRYLEHVLDGAARARARAEAIVSVIRMVPTPHIEVDLAKVVSRAAKGVSAPVVAQDLPSVLGDAEQLEQLFSHLLDNASKFGATRIDVSAEHDAGSWIIRVQDDGIGFDPQFATDIFQLFRRLHTSEYSGDGVGLAIVARIAELHDSTARAEGHVGEGASFFVRLAC